MEISSEILESLVMDNKDVIEVLKQENVTQEDIIFESKETGEDSEETEIEEIIEIIEEVEEEGDEASIDDNILDKDKLADVQDAETGEKTERNDRATSKIIKLYSFEEENSTLTSQFEKPIKNENSTQKVTKKQIINYDVDEDWQDEEVERVDELDNSELADNRTSSPRTQADKKQNNQTVLLSSNRLDLKIHMDGKVEGTGTSIEDGESTQEIVKNEENNLLYTVLGTKKQDLGAKQPQEKLDDQFVRMERLEENTIPVEGTIYYEGDNMETLYVAQAIDDNEQYQYDNTTIEQDEGQVSWETTNQEANQNQEEDNSQDQIFLHEDEDGQLYFKDASGTLQPVYLTEDGNYAIAENSDDNKESQSKSLQNSSTVEEDSFILPDMDLKSASSKQVPLLTVNNVRSYSQNPKFIKI
ncbi:hypothetical protein PUN28_008413 [Cardiocondyla obscurior]|uniref:Uncharacterized protein n=1 Tax=Cardiocondyla obscurior TaxID=286306 RepID=A0AAW2G3W4_9HYME